ncbi:uncharacterized protein CANTADRAFT_52040 [Suhomyces tanzawaensis NRRL Y-17324]|uniref:RRM domain-containing protein n=1 Tax=Suhomyces tanzawaensis NRRL Y-17324 TaxID=984487 RepID=A0A1E4SIF3_9ASCO|nr:uncharacterized protein CANTADRAFT_52040 [Suhomyces tanzawaensis NRRL Y-17324]ODV79260.1 hypothetical protein CANTADRAFT_52040 [Suhomyces tanzawaensis NRRL Y-17324]
MTYQQPDSGSIPEYNKNANPFFQEPPPFFKYTYTLELTCLPSTVKQGDLEELVDSIIEANYTYNTNVSYSVVLFTLLRGIKSHQNGENSSVTGDHSATISATLHLSNWELCTTLLESLNGFEWRDSIVDAKLSNTTPMPPSSFINRSAYYNPYFPVMPGSFNNGVNEDMSSGNFSPSTSLPPSPRYLSRRSSSNRSFDSRKNSRSRSVPKQPVPPFIVNMVSNRDTSYSPPIPEQQDLLSENIEDEDNLIYVKNEDTDELIKVNAYRLFIGNVPYSSTWAHLKHFLITRSKEIDPDTELSILRVEIPMQSGTLMGSYNRGSGQVDDMVIDHSYLQYQVPYSKSRGFAIVTTGNKETSELLIKNFDNEDFEGRSLTVRYDRFPDYNNYVLQQLHPSNPRSNSSLGHLAFERNMLQQKFYNGVAGNPNVPGSYMVYPYYYNAPQQIPNIHPSMSFPSPGKIGKAIPQSSTPVSANLYSQYQQPVKPTQETFRKSKQDKEPQIKFSSKTLADIDSNESHPAIPVDVDPKAKLSEDLEAERARDLVNSFEGINISGGDDH